MKPWWSTASIRVRLTAWYAVVLALMLVVYATATFVAVRHEFFEQFSFISADQLPEFQAILARLGKDGIKGLKKEDRIRLLSLPFKLIVSRHRLDVIDEALEARIVEARRIFEAELAPNFGRRLFLGV